MVWHELGSNPESTAPKASMLIITPLSGNKYLRFSLLTPSIMSTIFREKQKAWKTMIIIIIYIYVLWSHSYCLKPTFLLFSSEFSFSKSKYIRTCELSAHCCFWVVCSFLGRSCTIPESFVMICLTTSTWSCDFGDFFDTCCTTIEAWKNLIKQKIECHKM